MDKSAEDLRIEKHRAYVKTLPMKRMASGVLIRDANKRILMVKPSYKSVLEIPGGVVEANESPYQACKRELKEELEIELVIERLLSVDYNKANDPRTESLMFIFYGGDIESDITERIKVDGKEILSFEFMTLQEIKGKTTETLFRRLEMSFNAIENQSTFYLENQCSIKK